MFDLYLGLPHIHIHILVPKSCATILEYSFIHAVLRTSLPHRYKLNLQSGCIVQINT